MVPLWTSSLYLRAYVSENRDGSSRGWLLCCYVSVTVTTGVSYTPRWAWIDLIYCPTVEQLSVISQAVMWGAARAVGFHGLALMRRLHFHPGQSGGIRFHRSPRVPESPARDCQTTTFQASPGFTPVLSVNTISSTILSIFSQPLSLLSGIGPEVLNGKHHPEDPISFLVQNTDPILRMRIFICRMNTTGSISIALSSS